jgi:hypothetical protein
VTIYTPPAEVRPGRTYLLRQPAESVHS